MPDGYAVEAADKRATRRPAPPSVRSARSPGAKMRSAAPGGRQYIPCGKAARAYRGGISLRCRRSTRVRSWPSPLRRSTAERAWAAAPAPPYVNARRGVAVFIWKCAAGTTLRFLCMNRRASAGRNPARLLQPPWEDAVLMSLKLREISNEDTGN